MKQISITPENAGQRLDKLLMRLMQKAPKSFLYKMLRKKNITLNGKKAQGNELLRPGDVIKIFFSDETYEKFGGIAADAHTEERPKAAGLVPVLVPGTKPPEVLYQDQHIVLFNKPAGLLSQKAKKEDISLVEYLRAFLLSSGMTEEDMQMVHPALCSRLDRNTSGLVAAGISLAGLQTLNDLIRTRRLLKLYRCIVCGTIEEDGILRGYLHKDTRANQVTVTEKAPEGAQRSLRRIETHYHVLAHANDLTLLEVHLITGRSHQIRAHLSSVGHPVLGDPKYGDPAANRIWRAHGVCRQMLHAYQIRFPAVSGELSYLTGRTFTAPVPALFGRLMN